MEFSRTSTSVAGLRKKPTYLALILKEIFLLGFSALLFTLSFPSFISRWGWFPLAYVALVPLFTVINRASWLRTIPYGAFFGFISYSLYNYWLGMFHPAAPFILPPIYAGYFLLLFPLLKAADSLLPKYGYILQSLLWVCYEFIKASGFLAYSYGIMGYSQYLFLPLIRIAGLTGVWGVSLLVVFPSALLGQVLRDGYGFFIRRLKAKALPIIIYAVLFIGVIFYGILSAVNLEGSRHWKVALVQQNSDPWKGGYRAYEKAFNILTRLSNRALEEDPDIIIWSETSFVPAIDWHTRYRTDRTAYALVKRLREYLNAQKKPFLIGNDDGQLERDEKGKEVRVDYNATLLFQNGEIMDTYRKLHLVPFTEYFPYRHLFPGIYTWLRSQDTHFWRKGSEYTVFEAGGVKFSTPICFEDTFGYLGRNFIREGAEVLVNMTNDSWSNSVVAEMQHMSIAVFRAVENKRSVVRATNGGITCVIDPNGKIISRLDPFTEDYLLARVPVYTGRNTLYSLWGDWLALLLLPSSALIFLMCLVRLMIVRKKD